MYRYEYDGSECWYSIEIPDDVSPNIKPNRVSFRVESFPYEEDEYEEYCYEDAFRRQFGWDKK